MPQRRLPTHPQVSHGKKNRPKIDPPPKKKKHENCGFLQTPLSQSADITMLSSEKFSEVLMSGFLPLSHFQELAVRRVGGSE